MSMHFIVFLWQMLSISYHKLNKHIGLFIYIFQRLVFVSSLVVLALFCGLEMIIIFDADLFDIM